MTLTGVLCVGCSARPSRGSNSGGEPPPSGRTNGKGLRHFSMKVQSATWVHGLNRLSCYPSACCILYVQKSGNGSAPKQGMGRAATRATYTCPCSQAFAKGAGSSAATGFAKGCCCARACSLASANCRDVCRSLSMLLWSAVPILIFHSHIMMYAVSFLIIFWF